MQSKAIQWFFGVTTPQPGKTYNCLVAELEEENKISLKKYEIPRIDFDILTLYENFYGQRIFSIYTQLDTVYYLNALRTNEDDAVLLGLTEPKEGQPYNGYIVKSSDGKIIIDNYQTAPIKEIIQPGISIFNCNKQFFVVIDESGKTNVLEIVM